MGDWLPAAAVMGLIFWLSSQPRLPGLEHELLDYLFKKLGHVTAYAALSVFYLRAVHLVRRPFLLAFLLAVLYAAGDEIHQSTVPHRGATVTDVLIDAAGAGAALGIVGNLLARRGGVLRAAARAVTRLDR